MSSSQRPAGSAPRSRALGLRISIAAAILAGVLVIGVGGANAVVVQSTSGRVVERADAMGRGSLAGLKAEDVDCVLVLGAKVWGNRPSHMLEDRLIVGHELYQSGLAAGHPPKLLLSGDHHTKGYNEVQAMKDFMLERGVDSTDIFMDHAGLSTYESMIRAKRVFGVERMVIVTQAFHLNRALWLAGQVGIDAVGVPADLRSYLTIRRSETREIAARVKDFVVGIAKPNSYIDGPPIDITGNGNVTQD